MEQTADTSLEERHAAIGNAAWVMSLTDGALADRLDRIRRNVRSFSVSERNIFLAEAAIRLAKQNY